MWYVIWVHYKCRLCMLNVVMRTLQVSVVHVGGESMHLSLGILTFLGYDDLINQLLMEVSFFLLDNSGSSFEFPEKPLVEPRICRQAGTGQLPTNTRN